MAKKKDPMLVLPCTWGNASIGLTVNRIAVKIVRSALSLSKADKEICGKRLRMNIVAAAGNANPEQEAIPGAEAESNAEVVVDIKSGGWSKRYINFGLTFDKDGMPGEKLEEFAGRAGRIEVMEIGAIPDGEVDE